MFKQAMVLGMILASAVSASPQQKQVKPKNVYKLVPLSTSEAIITCQNGGDPTFKHLTNNTVMISCGPTLKAKWDGQKFTCPDGFFVWADEGEAIAGKDDYAYCGSYPLKETRP